LNSAAVRGYSSLSPAEQDPLHIQLPGNSGEALFRVNIPRFSVYGGLNCDRPDSADPLLDRDFRTRYGIGRVLVGIMPNMYAYAEGASSTTAWAEGFDVLAIGVHCGFSLKGFIVDRSPARQKTARLQ
jgi:hypothetical protein